MSQETSMALLRQLIPRMNGETSSQPMIFWTRVLDHPQDLSIWSIHSLLFPFLFLFPLWYLLLLLFLLPFEHIFQKAINVINFFSMLGMADAKCVVWWCIEECVWFAWHKFNTDVHNTCDELACLAGCGAVYVSRATSKRVSFCSTATCLTHCQLSWWINSWIADTTLSAVDKGVAAVLPATELAAAAAAAAPALAKGTVDVDAKDAA
jgi:hypothetical protein